MMKKLMIATLLAGFSVVAVANEAGPTTNDVKAALRYTGITPGATVTLGQKSYTLETISVSKAGPDTFVVTFTTK
jgi:uncharacterized protein YdeI (BOF family)